jgi:hypothetical protein
MPELAGPVTPQYQNKFYSPRRVIAFSLPYKQARPNLNLPPLFMTNYSEVDGRRDKKA